MDRSRQWYAVYTRTGCEKKVAENLTRKKMETYCPLNKLSCKDNDRKKVVNQPLFNSYVFVRIAENELSTLQNITGVISLVYWLNKPATINDAEIGMIKKVLNEYTNVKLEKTLREPHIKNQVQVFPVNDNIRIILPSLGYVLMAEKKPENEKVSVQTLAQHESLYPRYAVNQ